MIFCLRPERLVELGKAARTENNIIKNIAGSINWKKNKKHDMTQMQHEAKMWERCEKLDWEIGYRPNRKKPQEPHLNIYIFI